MRRTREGMIRPILLLTGLAAAGLALAGAPPAHAQIMAPSSVGRAALSDISVSQDGDKVSILIKLSGQPTSATAAANGDQLVLSVDGVDLAPLTLSPPSGNLFRHIAASPATPTASNVTLTGAAFGATETIIYRNAVLIETRLAEPKLAGASLMAAAPPAAKPATISAPAPVASPKPVQANPAAHPEPAAPISLLPGKTPPAAAPAPVHAKAGAYVQIAGLDAKACADAAAQLRTDEWALEALGVQVLCLIDADKDAEARASLDKLAAFSPEDWRVAFGGAALAERAHDTSTARIGYANARILAPTDAIKVGIDARVEALEAKTAS